MQPPFATRQCEPYILKQVLLPTQQSSFIHNLIIAYNEKLSNENEQFIKEFSQKQKKFQRHKEQLKLLPEIKSDPKLMNNILEEIILKQYEKQYATILTQSEKKSQRFIIRKTQNNISNNVLDKENCNKTFHVTGKNTKKQFSVDNGIVRYTQRDQNLFRINQTKKKFRTSMVKSSSFDGIRRPKTPFSTQTNGYIESMRNSSQDNTGLPPPQSGLKNYINLKDNKLSQALYGKKKRPASKVSNTTHIRIDSQMNITKKQMGNLPPQWIMRKYIQRQKYKQMQQLIESKSNHNHKRPLLPKYTKKKQQNTIVKVNSISQQQQQQEQKQKQKELSVQLEDFEELKLLTKNKQHRILLEVDNDQSNNNNQKASFYQQLQSSTTYRQRQQQMINTQIAQTSKRGYETKMSAMARNIESSRENANNKDDKVDSPYHISNFIRELQTYNVATNSHLSHKMNQSRRKLLHGKSQA